jgi:hypothetical protein
MLAEAGQADPVQGTTPLGPDPFLAAVFLSADAPARGPVASEASKRTAPAAKAAAEEAALGPLLQESRAALLVRALLRNVAVDGARDGDDSGFALGQVAGNASGLAGVKKALSQLPNPGPPSQETAPTLASARVQKLREETRLAWEAAQSQAAAASAGTSGPGFALAAATLPATLLAAAVPVAARGVMAGFVNLTGTSEFDETNPVPLAERSALLLTLLMHSAKSAETEEEEGAEAESEAAAEGKEGSAEAPKKPVGANAGSGASANAFCRALSALVDSDAVPFAPLYAATVRLCQSPLGCTFLYTLLTNCPAWASYALARPDVDELAVALLRHVYTLHYLMQESRYVLLLSLLLLTQDRGFCERAHSSVRLRRGAPQWFSDTALGSDVSLGSFMVSIFAKTILVANTRLPQPPTSAFEAAATRTGKSYLRPANMAATDASGTASAAAAGESANPNTTAAAVAASKHGKGGLPKSAALSGDAYLHTNCLAVIANQAHVASDLHPFAAQRLVSVLATFHRRSKRVAARWVVARKASDTIEQGDSVVARASDEGDRGTIEDGPSKASAADRAAEVAAEDLVTGALVDAEGFNAYVSELTELLEHYDQCVCLAIEVILACLRPEAAPSNKHLIYALLRDRSVVDALVADSAFASAVERLKNVVDHFAAAAAGDKDAADRDLEQLTAFLEAEAREWDSEAAEATQAAADALVEARFVYEEAPRPELFFTGPIWSIALAFTSDCAWVGDSEVLEKDNKGKPAGKKDQFTVDSPAAAMRLVNPKLYPLYLSPDSAPEAF